MLTICAAALGDNHSVKVWFKSHKNCRRSCAQKSVTDGQTDGTSPTITISPRLSAGDNYNRSRACLW